MSVNACIGGDPARCARARRRAAMREHYRKFLWDEQHGAAYEQTMKALAQAAADIVG